MSLLFEEAEYGVIHLPGDGGEIPCQWQSVLVYNPADRTAVLTDPEDSFTFTFEKIPQ